MNTRRLTPAVMIAATLAALFVAQGATAETAAPAPVVMMPTVQVTAQRSAVLPEVVRLPQVTIVGKREPAPATRLAQREAGARL